MSLTQNDIGALACARCQVSVTRRRLLRRGMCSTCYKRWLASQGTSLKRSPIERFWSKVDKATATGCWEWRGTRTPKGYGQFTPKMDHVYAHRFAYEMERGLIPDGMTVDHLCRNRGCVNPAHMEVVTRGENTRRGAHPRPCPHCGTEMRPPNLPRHIESRHRSES